MVMTRSPVQIRLWAQQLKRITIDERAHFICMFGMQEEELYIDEKQEEDAFKAPAEEVLSPLRKTYAS